MDDFEKRVEENEKRNDKYLKMFETYLKKKKLTDKTIRKHISNVDFYLNYYLVYYDVVKMEDGISNVFEFFDDWFIRKSTWASSTSIRENAASLKKFYGYMKECNLVSDEDYSRLCEILKYNMEDFLNSLEEYESDFYDFF